MSASTAELQIPVDALLVLIGARISAGQLVIHLADNGRVQKVEVNTVYFGRKFKRGSDGEEAER